MPFARAGLLAIDDSAAAAHLNVIRQARISAIKTRALVNPASDLNTHRDAGDQTFRCKSLVGAMRKLHLSEQILGLLCLYDG